MSKVFKFKTNLKCAGCIAKVQPLLDDIKEINKWSVDLTTPERILTVEMKAEEPFLVAKVFSDAGYRAELCEG